MGTIRNQREKSHFTSLQAFQSFTTMPWISSTLARMDISYIPNIYGTLKFLPKDKKRKKKFPNTHFGQNSSKSLLLRPAIFWRWHSGGVAPGPLGIPMNSGFNEFLFPLNVFNRAELQQHSDVQKGRQALHVEEGCQNCSQSSTPHSTTWCCLSRFPL